MRFYHLIILAVTCFLLGSCDSSSDLISIDEYIEQNNIEDVLTTASGLKYKITVVGNGEMPTAADRVTVKYKGYRTDDFVFDSALTDGVTFPLSNVIPGWTEGLQLFSKGGEGTLYIPSNLGYGFNSPSPDIPPNTDLIFDIELVNF